VNIIEAPKVVKRRGKERTLLRMSDINEVNQIKVRYMHVVTFAMKPLYTISLCR
jgi:hypothetical protein